MRPSHAHTYVCILRFYRSKHKNTPSSHTKPQETSDKQCEAHLPPPWFAPMATAAMRHSRREGHRSQEYGAGAARGAKLNSNTSGLGRHRSRTYITTTRCSARGGLQRNVQPCVPVTHKHTHTYTLTVLHSYSLTLSPTLAHLDTHLHTFTHIKPHKTQSPARALTGAAKRTWRLHGLPQWPLPQCDTPVGKATAVRNMEQELPEERSSTQAHAVSDATAVEHTSRHQDAQRAVGCRGMCSHASLPRTYIRLYIEILSK